MRALSRVLVIPGALALAALMSPAMAQTVGESAPPPAAPIVAAPPAPPLDPKDVKKALTAVRIAYADYVQCERTELCQTSFDSFGVGITFADGSIVPFSPVQRLSLSGHDCVLNADAAVDRGDRGLALQWLMAAYLRNNKKLVWLREHPDAVVAALRRCCGRK